MYYKFITIFVTLFCCYCDDEFGLNETTTNQNNNITSAERRIEMDDNKVKQMELFAKRYNHDLRNVFITSVDQPDYVIGTVFDSNLFTPTQTPPTNESWNYMEHYNNNYLDYNTKNNNSIEEINWIDQNANALDNSGWIPGTFGQMDLNYNQQFSTPSDGNPESDKEPHENNKLKLQDILDNMIDDRPTKPYDSNKNDKEQIYECVLVPKQEPYPNNMQQAVNIGGKLGNQQVYQLYRLGLEQLANQPNKYSQQLDPGGDNAADRRQPKSISTNYFYNQPNKEAYRVNNYLSEDGNSENNDVSFNSHRYHPSFEKKTLDPTSNFISGKPHTQSLRAMFKNIKQSLHNFLCQNIDDCYGGQVADDVDDSVGEDRTFQVIQNFPLKMFKDYGNSASSINRDLLVQPTSLHNKHHSHFPFGSSNSKIIRYDGQRKLQKWKSNEWDVSNQIIPFTQHPNGLVSIKGKSLKISPSLFNRDSYVPPELRLIESYGDMSKFANSNNDDFDEENNDNSNSNYNGNNRKRRTMKNRGRQSSLMPHLYYMNRNDYNNNNNGNNGNRPLFYSSDYSNDDGNADKSAVKIPRLSFKWNRDSLPLFRSFWSAPTSSSFIPHLPTTESTSSSTSISAPSLISLLHNSPDVASQSQPPLFPPPPVTDPRIRWPKPVFVIKQYEEYE